MRRGGRPRQVRPLLPGTVARKKVPARGRDQGRVRYFTIARTTRAALAGWCRNQPYSELCPDSERVEAAHVVVETGCRVEEPRKPGVRRGQGGACVEDVVDGQE